MRTVIFVMFAIVAATAAAAQSPAEMLKGRWVNESAYCGQSIYDITGVDPNGTVRGTFTCVKTNWKPVLGDVINKNAVKATLTGNHFVMVNADGGGSDLTLNGSRMEGKGRVSANRPENSVVYIKQ
jgi:hypothetical protein